MKILLPLPVLLLCSLSAQAELCSEISNDTQRLTCFDRQARCAVIEDTQERLICFDNRAHRTTLTPAPTPTEVIAPGESTDSTVAVQPESDQDPSDEEPVATVKPPPAAPSVTITPATEPAPVNSIEVETSAEIETEPATATAEELEEAFPVRDAPRAKADKPAPIELKASINDVYRDGRSLAIITLDNGQVWREIRKSRFNYRTGLDVTISTGVMGSNNLKADGMKKFVKVKRLQ